MTEVNKQVSPLAVLVVDQDVMRMRRTVGVLERFGCEIWLAASVAEADAIMHHTPFDCLIAAGGLPVADTAQHSELLERWMDECTVFLASNNPPDIAEPQDSLFILEAPLEDTDLEWALNRFFG